MKTDQLSIVHAAYLLGADTPGKVEKTTGVPYDSANQCLAWIRKADGDLERARRLRSEYSVATTVRRYHSDPEFRARKIARSGDRAKRVARRAARVGQVESSPRMTIERVAEDRIRAGDTNEEALAAVRECFPNAKTGANSIRWYRNMLIACGEHVPSAVQARRTRSETEDGM